MTLPDGSRFSTAMSTMMGDGIFRTRVLEPETIEDQDWFFSLLGSDLCLTTIHELRDAYT
jgi:hypothetical protein